ncbi:hypothetical protein AB1Y20_015341 [Prymnesium parvum]|uniref:ABC transporter domain-containing protein n=1 Tax=Prymnesium parvum TaxID=97485 RepID=A0AB34K0K0_PRYPA
MAATDAADAARKLLDDLIDAKPTESVLYRALSVPNSATVRSVALKAAEAMVGAAVAANKVDAVFVKLETVLDAVTGPATERIMTGLLYVAGELAGNLDKPALLRLMTRCGALFGGDSSEVGSAASKAVAAALRVAIRKGTIAAEAEPTALLTSSLATMAKANSPAESKTAACGIGASIGALGAAVLRTHDVMSKLQSTIESKSKDAAHAREAAILAIGQLCLVLTSKFEPYSIPMLPRLIQLLAEKDKKVADAATWAARSMLQELHVLSVKSVIGALYEGMQVVGGGGRVKIECLRLASLLALRAPGTMGPCLPECIPLVMECLNDSNAKVESAAKEALPELCKCVQNAEVASTLKDHLLLALMKPDTTMACIEEVMLTTFCNPMDGTSLAFMMPIVIRGIKDANYELVKKATVCVSNLCALIKESSDIAPFVPSLLPLLEKNLDHSSPDIRESSAMAKEKLLEGAGDLVDPLKRHKGLVDHMKARLAAAYPALGSEVVMYVADTTAAMLEEKLGGVVRVQYFVDAVGEVTEWITTNIAPHVEVNAELVAKLAHDEVELFKTMLSDAAKAILEESGDKDFAIDMQNIILAFAGRVLLRKADIRFERGHRYGLIGQNGTGKTTLLNRLAAKDINGFPQDLRTWYIRHEVLCDDGVTVRQFLKQNAPEDNNSDSVVEDVLVQVNFPNDLKDTFVNSLSGGWKMRMSIAISIIHNPELLLLDEPTNHLDRDAIEWLTKHLLSLKGVTIAVVSHDYDFVDEVCTDITHYDNGGQLGKPCHFVYYPMTFGQFQRLKPEIAAGLPRADHGVATAAGVLKDNRTPSEVSAASSAKTPSEPGSVDISSSVSDSSEGAGVPIETTIGKVQEMIDAGLIRPFIFPDPGKPEGIRTFRKPILTLEKINFKYPSMEKMLLTNISASLTLGSRAVIVGGNGSGKSTFLKLLIGDLEGEEGVGKAWKHPNLRLAYVAQQAMHHVEDHTQVTPIHYIQERFRQGLDAELSKLKSMTLTPEEEAQMKESGAVTAIVGRTQKGKNFWYEVQKNGRVAADTQSYPLSELESAMFKPYVKKLIKNFDQRQQAIESGMAIRPITAAEILQHLSDFGIDSQLAHGKIRQMSGGQRQRLVISAAFWSKPHVIALDEPTNYLDNDSVAALTKALKDFKGAVLTVSENEAFVAEISNEKWVVENGTVTVIQLRDAKCR